VNRLSERLGFESLPKKLSKFYELDFSEFIKRANKAKSKLADLDEWEEYFNSHKMRILTLINENLQLTEDIDSMVFDLYNVIAWTSWQWKNTTLILCVSFYLPIITQFILIQKAALDQKEFKRLPMQEAHIPNKFYKRSWSLKHWNVDNRNRA
jgi:hypothetical protein